jgi:transcriptional regulator with PAS, ATPase and Fis domain
VTKSPLEQLLGVSAAINETRQDIDLVARSDAKVLVTGESGVGKELVARQVHLRSTRVDHPFIAVNCAGMPETLLESELFGHAKGSFTGAYHDHAGKLEIADRGTVFLDEIGEMSLRMQALLLRFLEVGELQKVGAERAARRVNVRIIAATNRNLSAMIQEGQFREDLFYRLNVIHIVVPPLRERREDIPLLVDHFLQRLVSKGNGCVVSTIAPEAMAALVNCEWPGNVRQLQNVVERLVVTCRKDVVTAEDLPAEVRKHQRAATPPAREARATVTEDLYRRVVQQGESFWTAVYPLYMQREIAKASLREIVRRGLQDAHGNYRVVTKLFNMDERDYRRFLKFLRKHDCQLPFREFR